jgi:predicted metal-binding membrane protein
MRVAIITKHLAVPAAMSTVPAAVPIERQASHGASCARESGGSTHAYFLGACVLLFLASLAATIVLCRSMAGGMPMPGAWQMSMAWMAMPGQSRLAAALMFMGMWNTMMLAMMLPALAPALLRYRVALCKVSSQRVNVQTALAGLGYFAVWALVGVLVYFPGTQLAKILMASASLARLVPLASGAILVAAGVFQLTSAKARLLQRCRCVPAGCPTRDRNFREAWSYGIGLGKDCVWCCAGWLAVLLVTGMASFWSMGLVTVAISAERLLQKPERATRLTGTLLVVMALWITGRSLGAIAP